MMREDMAKVIVERPRVGSRSRGPAKGYRKRSQPSNWDNLPGREGIKRRSGGTKCLNEHLGPLRRYLLAQVGRPWDRVFSEICQRVNRNSAVQDHVRDHVSDYVVTNVVWIDGELCKAEPYGVGTPLALTWYSALLYVCPQTGLLRRVRKVPRRAYRQKKQEVPPRFVKVDATHQCRLIDGAWYLVTVERFPAEPAFVGPAAVRATPFDCLLGRKIGRDEAVRHYGEAVYGIEQRRLSKRDLRNLPVPCDWWNGLKD
jgi:hypothetical protein